MSDAFAAFEARWLARLQAEAEVVFRFGPLLAGAGTHTAIADEVAVSHGFQALGFNWELLDASAPEGEPRSALGEIAKALCDNIAQPGQRWLGKTAAMGCAHDFLDALDPATRMVVSNRHDGLWHPIGGASIEWGFVGFDRANAAVLLVAGH